MCQMAVSSVGKFLRGFWVGRKPTMPYCDGASGMGQCDCTVRPPSGSFVPALSSRLPDLPGEQSEMGSGLPGPSSVPCGGG